MDSAQANKITFLVKNGVIFKSTAITYKNFKQLMVMLTRSPVSHQLTICLLPIELASDHPQCNNDFMRSLGITSRFLQPVQT